jgi:hypothetical protein
MTCFFGVRNSARIFLALKISFGRETGNLSDL